MSNMAQLTESGRLRFSAVCQFGVPHTAGQEDIMPSINIYLGDFDSHHEAMSVALTYMNNNPTVFCAKALRRVAA